MFSSVTKFAPKFAAASGFGVRHLRTSSVLLRETGRVLWFDPKKGFGFIESPAHEAGDIFVHQTAIQAQGFRALAEGQEVEFDLEEDNGKTRAVYVTGPGGVDIVPPPRAQNDDQGDQW